MGQTWLNFTRTIVTPPVHGGQPCGDLTKREVCSWCQDCKVTPWTSWTACSATCGGGSRRRSRAVDVKPAGGGRGCPKLAQTEECGAAACVEDCRVGQWGSWTDCSCEGTRSRYRATTNEVSLNALTCPHLEDEDTCTSPCFHCDNGKHVPQSYKCDDDNDCGDWSDEAGCYSLMCRGGLTSVPMPCAACYFSPWGCDPL